MRTQKNHKIHQLRSDFLNYRMIVSQKNLSCLFSTVFFDVISLDLYINISEEIDSFYTLKGTYSWTL